MFGIGIGAGFKIGYVNTNIEQSISLTDNEAGVVNDITNVIDEQWILTDQQAIKDKGGNITGYEASVATKNSNGDLLKTGIKVNSGVNQDNKGNTSSNGVWSSKSYQQQSVKAEKEED